jgi:hypothetical protein
MIQYPRALPSRPCTSFGSLPLEIREIWLSTFEPHILHIHMHEGMIPDGQFTALDYRTYTSIC